MAVLLDSALPRAVLEATLTRVELSRSGRMRCRQTFRLRTSRDAPPAY